MSAGRPSGVEMDNKSAYSSFEGVFLEACEYLHPIVAPHSVLWRELRTIKEGHLTM